MTLRPVTKQSEIKAAYGAMAQRLKVGTRAFDCRISGYRSDHVKHRVRWHSVLGFWWFLDPEGMWNRWVCCYGTEDPKHRDMLSITIQTNSPFEGQNRRTGGLFVKDDAGRVYIAHCGWVHGRRPGIGKRAFWEFYGDEQAETVQWLDGRKSCAIVIAPVDSKRLPAHIARFVHEVARFKAAATGGKPVVRRERLRRIFTPEFEGQRRGYTPASEIEARCEHGTIVRRLHRVLTDAGHEAVSDNRRDLYVLANGAVTHLFEVKTDLSTTSLYQGVGQLMLHGVALAPVPQRILVIPSGRWDSQTRRALSRLGIVVLVFEWVDGQVEFPRFRSVFRQSQGRIRTEPVQKGERT